jgi:D-hydroxyproline dehydrogenase subunit alpha
MAEGVRFTLEGRHVEADAGTSLLAALWNLGARAVRTSASGAARGPLCAMGTCFECRVTVDGEPHVRACLAPVREGMTVSLRDGAPASREPRTAAAESLEAQVAVVGGGPAGLSAAVHAAEAGARTLLVDTNARPGGQIWRHRSDPPAAARAWLARLARSGARVVSGATVVDGAGHELLIDADGSARRVRFERLVLATGARELFLPFPGWTLPGVVGVGGAQALVKAGARVAGRRVVVAGSSPLLLAVAAALAKAGARIVGVAEQAPLARLAAFAAGLWRAPSKVAEGIGYAGQLAGAPYRMGAWVRAVEERGGALRATLASGGREWIWDCDVLATGYGLVPNLELARLYGCAADEGGVAVGRLQETSVPGVYAAGEIAGVAGVAHALWSGAVAGTAAAGREPGAALAARRDRERAFAARLAKAFALRAELRALPRPDTLVCRCEDVACGRLAGCASGREAKLATRAGMGPCQGRVCGPALGFLLGFEEGRVRVPLAPVPLAFLEGPADSGSGARRAL